MNTTVTCNADVTGSAPAVEVVELRHHFGATRALNGTTFAVEPGEIFGLLGPNGAGKTTVMRILLTLLRPTSGLARVAGLDVTANPVAVRRAVGWVPQERTADPLMTARENLVFVAGLYHLDAKAGRHRAAELLALVELEDHAERLVREFSGGMRRRLELAMGLVHVPSVLFLDEPTLGLDITSRRRLWKHVEEIRSSGTTVVLTTHYLDEADALGDRVAVIHEGRIRAAGPPAALKRTYGQARLNLQFDAPEPRLARRLSALEPVRGVRATAAVLELQVDDVVTATEQVLAQCRAFGVWPSDVWAERPRLDDVFLSLTGQPMEDTWPLDATAPR